MAKNLLAYGEYWEIIAPYWSPEGALPLESGLVDVSDTFGESGYTFALLYVGPTIQPGDVLSFTASSSPYESEEGEYDGSPCYVRQYAENDGPNLIPDTSVLLLGTDHRTVTTSVPAHEDMVYFGWAADTPFPGEFSIESAEGPAPAACFWTDLVNVTQECSEEPPDPVCTPLGFGNSGIWDVELLEAFPEWDGSGFSITIPSIEYEGYFTDNGFGEFYPGGEDLPCGVGPLEGTIGYQDGVHDGVYACVLVTNECW